MQGLCDENLLFICNTTLTASPLQTSRDVIDSDVTGTFLICFIHAFTIWALSPHQMRNSGMIQFKPSLSQYGASSL